jgi:adenylate cyclase
MHMSNERIQRRLVAILAADVVGYSRLMEWDEASTLTELKLRWSDVVEPLVARHQGRVFKTIGDAILAEFGSAIDAVECAIDLQQAMAAANADVPAERRIALRIGVHLGDVIVEGSDLYGDGVNVATRIEGLADPGGVVISDGIHEHIRGRLGIDFVDGGNREVKNIERALHIWTWSPQTATPADAVDGLQPPRGKPSIAVLPFDNMSGDPEQGYFADGITEDIITDLSKVSGLFVIARNSSFAYKGQAPDVRKVSRELGVRYVLEGSVRRAANRIRINAQMIDATTGGHLWAERYDRGLEDIFAEYRGTTSSAHDLSAPFCHLALLRGQAPMLYRRRCLFVRASIAVHAIRFEQDHCDSGPGQNHRHDEHDAGHRMTLARGDACERRSSPPV